MGRINHNVEPHLFVVFGATGDLMRRKLLPALYHLTARGALRNRCQILGIALDTLDDRGFRSWARRSPAAGRPPAQHGDGHLHGRREAIGEALRGLGRGALLLGLGRRLDAHDLPLYRPATPGPAY